MDNKKNEENPQQKSEETPKPRTRRTRRTASSTSKKASSSKKEAPEEASAKEPSNLAESIEWLKVVGLRNVSNKTFINQEDLEAFLDEDFSHINKVRAMGFIQILEREYPVKLEELRQKYLQYHAQHKSDEKQQLFVHAKNQDEFAWKRYVPWLAGLLLVGGIVWYLSARSSQENLSTVEAEQKAIVADANSDILEKAKTNLKALEAAEEKGQNSTKKEAQVPTEQKESAKREAPAPQSDRAVPFVLGAHKQEQEKHATSQTPDVPAAKPEATETTAAKSADNMEKGDDLDLDAMVKEMVQEYNITDDTTDTTMVPDANVTPSATQTSVAAPAAHVSKSAPKREKAVSKKSAQSKKKVQKSLGKGQKKSIAKSKLYIVPRQKSWVGVIYLDNYTKKDYLIKKELRLDASRPQLIVVGHNKFEIYNNGYSYRFRGKGPIRFVYKNGEIMQINNREFQRLSKGTSW